MLAPYSNALLTDLTSLIEAPNISVLFQFCFAYTLAISFIRHNPPNELSSTLPTNGETYVAPALAASIACDGENIRVTFTLIKSFDRTLQAASPPLVHGTLIVV